MVRQCFRSLSHIVVLARGAVIWFEKRTKDRSVVMHSEYSVYDMF